MIWISHHRNHIQRNTWNTSKRHIPSRRGISLRLTQQRGFLPNFYPPVIVVSPQQGAAVADSQTENKGAYQRPCCTTFHDSTREADNGCHGKVTQRLLSWLKRRKPEIIFVDSGGGPPCILARQHEMRGWIPHILVKRQSTKILVKLRGLALHTMVLIRIHIF